MPNKTEYDRTMTPTGVFLSILIKMLTLFFSHTLMLSYEKFCLATIRSGAFFGVPTSVGALFYFCGKGE